MNRDDLIAVFLARNGFAPSDAGPLAQDASFRRYLRIRGDRPAVLMDAPPPEDVRPFLRIAAHLRAHRPARSRRSSPPMKRSGLVLEEDLGDDLLSRAAGPRRSAGSAAGRGGRCAGHHAARRPAGRPAAVGRRDDGLDRARHAVRLVVAGAVRRAAPAAARDDVAAALAAMLEPVAAGPPCFVHRDYFAGNLLRLPDEPRRHHRLPGRRPRPSGL